MADEGDEEEKGGTMIPLRQPKRFFADDITVVVSWQSEDEYPRRGTEESRCEAGHDLRQGVLAHEHAQRA